jgi:hypothetical protein
MVDKLLSTHAANFVNQVTKSLNIKLELHFLVVTEVNMFMLLLSNAMDNIMEYTNESYVLDDKLYHQRPVTLNTELFVKGRVEVKVQPVTVSAIHMYRYC